jgi:hypothetical protein
MKLEQIKQAAVIPVLCAEKTWGSAGIAPPFLASALDGGDYPISLPSCFTLKTIAV